SAQTIGLAPAHRTRPVSDRGWWRSRPGASAGRLDERRNRHPASATAPRPEPEVRPIPRRLPGDAGNEDRRAAEPVRDRRLRERRRQGRPPQPAYLPRRAPPDLDVRAEGAGGLRRRQLAPGAAPLLGDVRRPGGPGPRRVIDPLHGLPGRARDPGANRLALP